MSAFRLTSSQCVRQATRRLARLRTPPPASWLWLHASSTRAFTSSALRAASLATDQPPSKPTILLSVPSQDYLEQEEIDAELPPTSEVRIVITDRAAERLRDIAKREGNVDAALRIAVESGGCHGYQYKMDLASESSPDDYKFSHPTIQPSNLIIDAVSLTMLNGSTVDFATELIGSSFRIAENPKAKGSGCGCGVSWELKSPEA